MPENEGAMLSTPEQLYQAIEQMGRMQRILESYRDEILTKNLATLPCWPRVRWIKSASYRARSMNMCGDWR